MCLMTSGSPIPLSKGRFPYRNKKKEAALILLIDFKKAFDSIDLAFIDKSLKLFGFGENVQNWKRTFFNKRTAFIISGGHQSKI